MTAKKNYVPPQIFEVPLRQEQAVLALCDSSFTSASANSTILKCTAGGCKKPSSGGTANTPPNS